MDKNKNKTFNTEEINKVTKTSGVIPADVVTNEQPTLKVPEINLSETAPQANQALTEAGAQVESQTKLDELTNQRIADTNKQRQEQMSLIGALGEQGQEIQDAFTQGEESLKPIEKEIMELTGLINTKQQAIQNQLLDESGRRIPQAFITGRQAIIQQRGTAELSALSGLLDAKNGQMQLAQNKLDRSLNIMREVNAMEVRQKEAMVNLRKEITGESKEEEEKEITRLKEEQAKFEKERDEISSIALQAMQAGAGSGEIAAITGAKSRDEAIAAAKSLGRMAQIEYQISQANLAKAYADLDKARELEQDSLFEPTGSPTGDVTEIMRISGAKSSQAIADTVNVLAALEDFASNSQDGKFKGIAKIRRPGFLIGDGLREEKQRNIGDMEAINLKVQQWASGASLTDKQTKQVKRLVPDKNDTDRQVRNKSNQLANYMATQVRGALAAQGVGYEPEEIDFWNQDPLGLGTQPTGDNDPLGIN